MIDTHKAAMIGCGLVGSTTVFSLMQRELFSEIVMIDTDTDRAVGEAMDLSHGMSFIGQTDIHQGYYDELGDADIIMISAGVQSSSEEDRLSLASRNVATMENIIDRIMSTNFEGIILVISNPVDVLTYVAWVQSGLPYRHIIGSGTVLDTARLKSIIGSRLDVDRRCVHGCILGEHGDSEFVPWSRVNISGVPIYNFCRCEENHSHSFNYQHVSDYEQETAKLLNEVRKSAYEIIKRKRATYYGIAMAVTRICDAIIRDEKTILPVSGIMQGEYDLYDVALSMPCIVGAGGIESHVPYPLNEEEYGALRNSANVIKNVLGENGY